MNPFEPPPPTDDPRERLVLATLAEIEERGLAHVTVRAIASRAGVNIAAANYYFGAKRTLVEAALSAAVDNMLHDTEAYLAEAHARPLEALTRLFNYFLEGAIRYPRVGRAQLHDAFASDDYGGPFPTRFRPIMEHLRDLVREVVPGLDKRGAARRALTALSSVLFPALFPGFCDTLVALDSERERRAFARSIAEQMLAPTSGRQRKTLPKG